MPDLDSLGIPKEEIFRLVSTPIHVIDKQMRLVWRNKASKDIFTKEEGTYCYEIIAEKKEICNDCIVVEVLKDGIVRKKERKFRKKFFEVEIVPFFNKPSGIIMGVVETLKDNTATIVRQQKLEKANKKIKGISITDFLTRVYNRRGITSALKEEFLRAKRFRTQLSIISFDLDNLKLINDSCGHAAGDKALKTVASLVKGCLRQDVDKIGRLGGDEFVILLPGTMRKGAEELEKRIKKAVNYHKLKVGGKEVIATISTGIAEYSDGLDIKTLLHSADQGLYGEKRKKIR